MKSSKLRGAPQEPENLNHQSISREPGSLCDFHQRDMLLFLPASTIEDG